MSSVISRRKHLLRNGATLTSPVASSLTHQSVEYDHLSIISAQLDTGKIINEVKERELDFLSQKKKNIILNNDFFENNKN